MNGETSENCYLVWLLGVVIEEITEENTAASGENKKQSKEVTGTQRESNSGGIKTDVDGLQALRDDPEAIRFNTIPNYCIDRCVVSSICYHLQIIFTTKSSLFCYMHGLNNLIFIFVPSLALQNVPELHFKN